ncbi:MAG: hypothetical protein JXA21_05345 [Anaerolineae bacterium]|nr:hypothetical protein [Anaerolineae bacterium]
MSNRYDKLATGALLLSWLALPVTGVAGCLAWPMVALTFLGCVGAAIGGITIGVTARRYLAGPEPNLVFGLGTTSAIGTVALGFVYIFLMHYHASMIGTFSRTFSQSLIFGNFLVAQVVGLSPVYTWLAVRLRWDDHA